MTKQMLNELVRAGAEKAAAVVSRSTKYEMNVDSGDLSLIRTTDDVSAELLAIKDSKKGTMALNRTDAKSVSDAARATVALASAAEADPAHDIAPYDTPETFTAGPEEPDRDAMYDRLSELMRSAAREYPNVVFNNLYFSFRHGTSHYRNTNGVDLRTSRGAYHLSVMAMGRDGEAAGSFNGTGFSTFTLDKPLMEYGSVRNLMAMCAEQIHTSRIGESFTGDVIFSPDCFDEILTEYVNTFLSDRPLISGASVLKGSLGEQVASALLTIRATPTDPKLSGGYRVFSGFKAQDEMIFDKGVLRAFDLSLYGANKTGLPRSKSGFGGICVDAGTTPYADMVRSVKRGLLVCRFSGGHPAANGDLSGVAKNSYYIENGEIRFPVGETMIAGNLRQMFSSIGAVSLERTDYGSTILPSVLVKDVKITG